MILIAASSSDGIIGEGRGVPWGIPEEYERFLELIRGQTVIMGRRSFEIFGKDLTSRYNIVLSRLAKTIPGAQVAHSLDQAVRFGEMYGFRVFCAGGDSVFEQALPLADRMLLSVVKSLPDEEASFPHVDAARWRVRREVDFPQHRARFYERAV